MARPRPSLRKIYYQISEVALLTGVNESTLRNWEGQYNELNQIRRINRRRHYTAKDIQVIERIKDERSAKKRRATAKGNVDAERTEHGLVSETQAASKSRQTKQRQSAKLDRLVSELKQLQTELRSISKTLSK